MCGITGYIGESKDPETSFNLITNLFEKSEIRGIDAAGYWGVSDSGDVLYNKEPGTSSSLIKKQAWQSISNHNPKILIAHARGASKGFGTPLSNKNNHPFTNHSRSVGLIHNGRIDDSEYQTLKEKCNLKSECDSEILLRIFESSECSCVDFCKCLESRLLGIRNIFSFINEGHMAVAIGERLSHEENILWLFRNRYRPLWVSDMREVLGQIFFVSEPNIWSDAIAGMNISRNQKLIEITPDEVWQIRNNSELLINRYRVIKGKINSFKNNIEIKERVYESPDFNLITQLDEKDNIIKSNKIPTVEINSKFLDDINYKCQEIIEIINNINICVEEMSYDQSLNENDCTQLHQDLENYRLDLMNLESNIKRGVFGTR